MARAVRQRPVRQQRAQHGERLVEPAPTLLERHPEDVVVALRGAGPHGRDEPTLGEDVDGGERLGQRHRTAQDGERHGRGKRQRAGALDHARERGRAVEPGRLKEEVVVGRDRGEAALPGGVDRRSQPPERERLVAERHQRQMDAEVHDTMVAYARRPCGWRE
jgi:hypothetical protein